MKAYIANNPAISSYDLPEFMSFIDESNRISEHVEERQIIECIRKQTIAISCVDEETKGGRSRSSPRFTFSNSEAFTNNDVLTNSCPATKRKVYYKEDFEPLDRISELQVEDFD